MIRRHRFHEIARESPMKALSYLQTELAATVDHGDAEETSEVGYFIVPVIYLIT